MLDAAIQAQSTTTQKDICHCTAHYLRSALTKSFIVKISPIRIGRGFSNLLAELIQDDTVRISTHLIFTTLPDAPQPALPSSTYMTLSQPSPLARVIPHQKYPSKVKDTPLSVKFTMKDRIGWAEDADFVERRRNLKESNGEGEGGLEWAAWMSLKDSSDKITPAVLYVPC